MNKKEKIKIFEDELNLIKDSNIKKFAKEIINNADDYFFSMPASTSGKYHPEYTCVPGGLLLHTKAVMYFTVYMIETDIFSIGEHEKDLLIVSALAHDIKKMGDGKLEVTVKNHPELAAEYIKYIYDMHKNLVSLDDINYIMDAVRKHMGKWGSAKTVTFNNDGEKVLHIADYIASRKNVKILFNAKNNEKILPSINDYVVNFGKYNGKHFNEIPKDYLNWCNENIKKPIFSAMLKKYLKENKDITQ